MARLRQSGRRLALAVALLSATAAAEAHACSLGRFPVVHDGIHLIGVVEPDTLLAGRGAITYGVGPGHFGPAGDRTIYGQGFRVERVGGADAAEFLEGTSRVVVVPWDFGPDCRTTAWTASARWLPGGERRLVWGSLRDPADWVDGVPTIDALHAGLAVYPSLHLDEEDGGDVLDVDAVFDLMQLLPLAADLDADAEAAVAPLIAWMRANPDDARRAPVPELAGFAVDVHRSSVLTRMQVPFAGTYRFTLSIGGDSARTFFVRTFARPWREEYATAAGAPGLDDPVSGYVLALALAAGVEGLPVAGWEHRSGGSVDVDPAPVVGNGVSLWRARYELGGLERLFAGDAAVAAAVAAWREGYWRRADEPPRGGRFELRADGAATYRERIELQGGAAVLAGERISRVTTDVLP